MVTLRAHSENDFPAMVEQSCDPDTLRFTAVPRPYSRERAEKFLATSRREWEASTPTSLRIWAISVENGIGPDRYGGMIEFHPTDVGTATVGFGLHPSVRGHRHTFRALNLVLDYVFDRGGIELVHWQAAVGNWASRKTVWRAGFRLEGTVRGWCRQPGHAQDGWIASLHRDDPRRPCEPWPTADGRY